MKTIEISSDDVDPPDWVPDARHVAQVTLESTEIDEYEIGIRFCGDSLMSELSSTYRGISEPTDVLSFSQAEGDEVPGDRGDVLRGDVVISLDSVRRNAAELGIDPGEESIRVIVHGLLHLAGYEHDGTTLADDAASSHPMFILQERVVSELIKERDY